MYTCTNIILLHFFFYYCIMINVLVYLVVPSLTLIEFHLSMSPPINLYLTYKLNLILL